MAKSKTIDHTGWGLGHKDQKADIPKWRNEVYEIKPDKLVLHEMANEHPKMTEDQFEAFKQIIETEGQRDPVITFRGKIVDGRHRWWALKEINADKILYVKMPHRSTEEEIRKEVGLSEARRHQTPTQLAIKAYREGKNLGESFRATARRTGISHSQLTRCKYIEENLGAKTLDDLWNGKKIRIGTKSNLDSLSAIVAEDKRIKDEEKQKDNERKDMRYTPESKELFSVIDYISKLSEADFGYLRGAIKKESAIRAEKDL